MKELREEVIELHVDDIHQHAYGAEEKCGAKPAIEGNQGSSGAIRCNRGQSRTRKKLPHQMLAVQLSVNKMPAQSSCETLFTSQSRKTP